LADYFIFISMSCDSVRELYCDKKELIVPENKHLNKFKNLDKIS